MNYINASYLCVSHLYKQQATRHNSPSKPSEVPPGRISRDRSKNTVIIIAEELNKNGQAG